MIITCENCSTRFTLDESLLQPEGSKVRCSQCRHVFIAMPPAAAPEDAPLEMDLPEEVMFDAGGEEDADSGDLNFDTEFEEMDFDQDLDFDETDLGFEPDQEDSGPDEAEDQEDAVQDDEIEFEMPDLEVSNFETESGQDIPDFDAAEEEEIPDEDEFSDLELDPSDQDLTEIEEIEFQDLELQEEEDSGDDADIEISFDEDDTTQDLEAMSLEMESPDSDDDDFETEGISLETEDFEFETDLSQETDKEDMTEQQDADEDQLPSLEGLEMQEDDAEDLLEPDLALSFEDDLAMEEIEFDEPDEELESDEEDSQAGIQEFQPDADADLSIEDDDAPEFEQALEDEKFAGYDQVLEQDTEPEEDFPELDEELNDPAVSPPEDQPEPEPATAPPSDEEPPSGPLIAPDSDGGKRRIKKRKSGLGAPVKILVLLFLLVIAAYLISLRLGIQIPFLDQVNIPFITQAFKPAPPPVAATGPLPNDASTNGKFVTNATAGRLFIVTGKVDNPDKIAYSHIRVRGTLLTKGNKKAATQTVYCGNVISDEDLKSGNISDITKQLATREGIQNTNVNIRPGASVRFMLVFSNLPENLTNFTVEVLDYKHAGPQ